MPVEVAAALIGAVTSVAVLLLGAAFNSLYRRRERKESARIVYRKYVDPLHVSTEALFWRLHEAFGSPSGGFYLTTRAHVAVYEHYKATSTLFRVAALLGWIRGLRRELFFLSSTAPKNIEPLEGAIKRVEKLLADGSHMEIARVESLLLLLWPETTLTRDSDMREAGARLDRELDRELHQFKDAGLSDLDDEETRKQIVVRAAMIVGESLHLVQPQAHRVDVTWRDCFTRLAVPEAWVYRDWQSAIGDVMLREDSSGPRRYEVVGFREFEQMCEAGSDDEKKWLKRLNSVLDGVDLAEDPSLDARIDLLTSLYVACSEIICAIDSIDGRRSNVTAKTRDAARKVQKESVVRDFGK